ncbi:MAG TPA: argininosuccinate lyase [Blastocatellia bacterium]|nr:argininosuccinate lyase [Blastocatellia bacterium]
MKLWGGRFTGQADEFFSEFNASFAFDRRLFEADIQASIAHSQGLLEAGIINKSEAQKIKHGLETILRRGRTDGDYFNQYPAEDIHSFVEARLVQLIGDTGYKLHTGRSRNDQVATDLRIFLREEITKTQSIIKDLLQSIVDLAEANVETVIPGYTHLQKAQPVLFAHYLLAYFEMLSRDVARLNEIRARVNVLPLGSGALAGTGFAIDRQAIAKRLDFDSVAKNSIDAVSDRDIVIEFIGAASLMMVHLSRLAEDFIIYSTTEFNFIELSDAVATGSSLMPQKKNPDSLELIRGKAGRIFGHHAAMLATMKGLPLAYNKDMQEDKEALFDTIDTLNGSLKVTTTVLRNLRVNAARTGEAAGRDYTVATELADYLVRKGLEFRNAHEIVGKVVVEALSEGKQLDELSLEQYRQHSNLFGDDLFQSLTIDSALSAKSQIGGTSPERVRAALNEARAALSN